MEEMSGFLLFFIIVIILIFVICYAALAIFLNNFNKKMYGESTVMAWIPFANIYLLGKLTFNKDAGYGLTALLVLSGTIKLTFDRTTIVLSLPNIIQMILGAVFAGTLVATIIFGVRKYGRIKNNPSNNNEKVKTNEEIEKISKENDAFFDN